VARDRQRSKARKRARAAGQKPRSKSSRSRARDIGLDDPAIDEAGLTDDAPAPDPLKNASPDVDQARAVETGAERGPAGEEVDLTRGEEDGLFERGEDEVEIPPDLVYAGAGGGGRGGGGEALEGEEAPAAEPKDSSKVVAFLRASAAELRRVQWPDRKHVFQATAVVLGFCLIAGAYLGLMDAIWQPLINAIL